MSTDEQIIIQTKKWITDVIISCNFCPFAAKAIKQKTIYFQVEESAEEEICLQAFLNECRRLDDNKNIETTFLIFSNAFKRFDYYLNAVFHAEEILRNSGYEGIYQVASFHPLYCFANSNIDDAANFTNRSIYPMLHLLREERVENALLHYARPQNIPINNIKFAREKGTAYMKMLRDSCL